VNAPATASTAPAPAPVPAPEPSANDNLASTPALEAIGPVAAQAPSMTASPTTPAAGGSVNGMGRGLLDWLQTGGSGDAPAAAPLMWTAAAFSRREIGGKTQLAGAAAATSSGEPASPFAPLTLKSPNAAATGDPFADFIRIFIGNGDATNPNAGLLIGNGYSYTSYAGSCTTGACDGGRGGFLFGSGGNGFAGGVGGSTGLWGDGGAGGAGVAGVNGGVGAATAASCGAMAATAVQAPA
jgi:hypothetical protein